MQYRSWVVLGRLAEFVLSAGNVENKPLLVREAELANRFSLSRGTLRNYRDAVSLVRRIPDPELRRALHRLSAAAAAQMVRWLQRDYDAATRFLVEHPYAGPRDIIAAERARSAVRARGWSRLGSLDETVSRLPNAPLRFEIADALNRHDLFSGKDQLAWIPRRIMKPDGELARFYRIDWLLPLHSYRTINETGPLVHAGAPLAEAAILEIPRYGLIDRYGAEARALWARAVAATTAYPLVVLVFPGPASRRRFVSALPVELVARIDGEVSVNQRSEKAPFGRIVFPAQCLGGIVITTRLNGLRDLTDR